jgi:peroxiredoxin
MRQLIVVAMMFSASAAAAAGETLKPWRGGAAPALELRDLDGGSRSLDDYRGKVVLVNFWASWCEPCRAEMPSIERLRRAMGGRPFVVLAVNVGDSSRVAREFAEKLSIGFTVLLDRDGRATRAWGAKVLPASFVIGPDGSIRYSYLGELDWSGADVRSRIESLIPPSAQRASRH